MTIFELFNSQQELGKLIKLDMHIKKAYELRKFILEIEQKLNAFNLIRNDLIKKYGEEKKGQTFVKEENIEKFNTELSKIGNEEITIEIPKITIDDIDGKISTDTLIKLSYLIK